jgi:hypothetical protein
LSLSPRFFPRIIICFKLHAPQHKCSCPLFCQIWHALHMWPCYATTVFPKWMSPTSDECARNEPNPGRIPFHYIPVLLANVVCPWFRVTKLTISH